MTPGKRWGNEDNYPGEPLLGLDKEETVDEEGEFKLYYVVLRNKWPISFREVIYFRTHKEMNGAYYILEKGLIVPEVPIEEGCERAFLDLSGFEIKPIDENTSSIKFLSHIDPRGTPPNKIKGEVQWV